MATRKSSDAQASSGDGVIVTLDDGTQVEFATVEEAREAYPRAWVRLKSEVDDSTTSEPKD